MRKPSFVNTLSGRMLLLGVLPTMLVIGAIVTLNTLDDFRDLRRVEEHLLELSAQSAANELSIRNDRWNNVAAVMALAQNYGMFGQRKASCDFVKTTNAIFPLIVGAFIVYEPNADGQDAAALNEADLPRDAMDANGRFVPNWRKESGIDVLHPRTGMDSAQSYQATKGDYGKSGKSEAVVAEPLLRDGQVVVTHAYPIVIQGRFAGNAGVDRDLGTLSGIAANIKSRIGAEVFILSAGDRFISATTDGAGGSNPLRMQELAKSPYSALAGSWRSGKAETRIFEAIDPVLGEPCIYARAPVEIGGWNVIVRRTKADVLHAANAAMKRNIVVGIIGLAIVGCLMFFVTHSVSWRVRCAAEVANRIASGDLTQPISESSSRDETGQLIKSMSMMDSNLNSLIGTVKKASIGLNSTATEMASSSRQQEASASSFGASSSQIAAAVKEISATSTALVRTMDEMNAGAIATAHLATDGRKTLQGMEGRMGELDKATESVAEKLATINEKASKITAVVTTITKVADQTNLLSVNAAIEAEKAGEYGAGFLVVAREIRRLADQTAGATLDIEQMVQQMQSAVSAGVMEMDRFSEQVRRGVQAVAALSAQMSEIIERVNSSSESFRIVNEGMQSQSQGTQQISEAMVTLTGNATQTMQSIREFGQAATELQTAIASLRSSISTFKLRD